MNKEKRFLITTADERSWKLDQPVLFLGEWCKLYDRRSSWEQLSCVVLPYHWSDQQQLYHDYLYLDEFYERMLIVLSSRLNQIHGVDHELRYWRILVGPWLLFFIQILFDRWTSINKAISEYDLIGTSIIQFKNIENFVPNDMEDFDSLIVEDEWNHMIYGSIIEFIKGVPVDYVVADTTNTSSKNFKSKKNRFKYLINSSYSRIASLFVRQRDAFFINTYLPNFSDIHLQLRFNQFPQRWSRVKPVQVSIDPFHRSWSLESISSSKFELFVGEMIMKHIPRLFLEGYSRLFNQLSGLPWPKYPKFIFTSNDLWFGTVTMAYTAEKVLSGSKIIYAQHGGVYGITKFSSYEIHEIKISDRYLSWGWNTPACDTIVPVGMISRINYSKNSKQNSRILLVLGAESRFSRVISSALPIASGLLNYFEDTYIFANSLPGKLKEHLLVRPYIHELGWQQSTRWMEKFPDIYVDNGSTSMSDLISNSRISVYTYNSTGYLESFASDIPAVLFWSPNTSPLRDSACPYFQALQDAGIFHTSPESAAAHICKVWDSVEDWWMSTIVRDALAQFNEKYCFKPKKLIDDLESALKSTLYCS